MPEVHLTWQPGFSLSRRPTKRSAPRENGQHGFKFVAENPQRARRARLSPSVSALTQSRSLSHSSGSHCTTLSTHISHAQSEVLEATETPIGSSLVTLSDQSLIASQEVSASGTTRVTPISWSSEDQSTICWPPEPAITGREYSDPKQSATVFPESVEDPFVSITSVSSAIKYDSLAQRFKPILTRYNTEFCAIPLTFHLRINPFRYRTDLDPEPIFLVHAVMALAGHHLNSTSALHHRHTAIKLLRQGLDSIDEAGNLYSILDTIVILFSLDETQSMLGNWTTHLAGAYTLLETCGGINALVLSSRLEAQIGILTWFVSSLVLASLHAPAELVRWDAITSLLSREACVFPRAYFDAVLANQHKREWDFFGLCGCPTDLVKIVMEIAHLGTASSAMHDSAFNNAVISEIQHSLKSWCHTPDATAFQDEEPMHQDRDVMHCSEAWRHGLLLYIYRVFHWVPGSVVPQSVLYRARSIVDHVVSCRDADMMSRQALLPLFFAGCELRDPSTRAEVLRLCYVWDERTRYHIFRGAIPLLEKVWAEQEKSGFENVWWGQIVDEQHMSTTHPLKMRLCFG